MVVEAGNSRADCYSFFNSTTQLIIDLSVTGATTLIGVTSSITAIVLMLIAKAYKVYIYRLLLYMAITALFICLAELINNLENDYNIQYEISIPTNIILIYTINTYSFELCWLGLYLFSLAVFRVQLKKPKHEVIGLVAVLVTPLTFLWVFPWMIRSVNLCIDTKNFNEIKYILFFNLTVFSSMLLSCFFIGAVLITLCKNAVDRVENTLQQQHRKAVRETIPLVVFMIAHQITIILLMVIAACLLFLAEEGKGYQIFLWQCYDLWPIVTVSLPILLLCQPHIRHRLKCKRPQRFVNMNITSGYGSTVHQSNQSSYTHYSSPHEIVGTD